MLAHRRRMSKSVLLPRIAVANSALLATSSVNGLNYGRVSHNHLFHHRRPLANAPEDVPDSTWAYGYALLAGTAIMFLATMYAIVGSKFAPDTQIKVLDWIKYDQYYCLLVPITAVVWIYFIIWNWMGMKFFRHN